jgi:GNAT superfamily N-acetyltransferase
VAEIFEGFTLRQICPEDDTNKFSLGNSVHTPLKIFLKKNALDFHQYGIAKTYVLINQNLSPSRILAYITLMSSEIVLNINDRPRETSAMARYEAFPAVKIARLAVDKTIQGKGWGRIILDWCINHIRLAIMPYIGCRFLVVDSKPDAIKFYEKEGFVLINSEQNKSNQVMVMFLDLLKARIYQSDNIFLSQPSSAKETLLEKIND